MNELARELLRRTLLLRLRVRPPPPSLRHSLAVFDCLSKTIGPGARVLHYRQEQCPVTKERLERLVVLVDDLGRTQEDPQVALLGPKPVLERPALTEVEKRVIALRTPVEVAGSTVELTHLTRDQADITSVRGIATCSSTAV